MSLPGNYGFLNFFSELAIHYDELGKFMKVFFPINVLISQPEDRRSLNSNRF